MNVNLNKIKCGLIIDGYIRFCEENFDLFSLNKTIPKPLNRIIFDYCYLIMEFYKKNHGEHLLFINNNTVKKTKTNGYKRTNWSSCVYGQCICDNMCDKFKITIKCVNASHFCLGFITKKDINKCIKEWNKPIGGQTDNDYRIHLWNGGTNIWYLDPKNKPSSSDWSQKLDYHPRFGFARGHCYTFLFNFKEEFMEIYHENKIMMKQTEFKEKSVQIAMSLWGMYDEIKIINFSLE